MLNKYYAQLGDMLDDLGKRIYTLKMKDVKSLEEAQTLSRLETVVHYIRLIMRETEDMIF